MSTPAADTATPEPKIIDNPELPPAARKTFMGHPVGLFILFFTEMWERFSYYGMRALLVLYMVNYLFVEPERAERVLGFGAIRGGLESVFGPLEGQPLASQIYGLYTGFVYLTPLFGGMLADRVLGQRRTVVVGGVLMAIGHFLMAFEDLFFLALFFLILGNGAFKPNISTQVGRLYVQGDPRRDGAFTIFYMGINLGAFLAPLICGTLGQSVGWHYGFSAAGVGMVLGLIIYLTGQRFLAPDTLPQKGAAAASAAKVEPLTGDEWKRIFALIFLCALNIVFWAVYEQQGNTMQLWADERTDWSIGSWEIPSTWFQSFNPFMIFVFAPLLNLVWAWQDKRGGQPSSVTKMALGCFLLGLAFVTMIFASNVVPEGERGSVMWLLTATFVLTIGELYLSPIGLSLVTKVAPVRLVSMLMGMWFLSSFFGNYLSGYLGTFYTRMDKDQFFMMLTALGIVTGALMMVANRPLKRALGGKV